MEAERHAKTETALMPGTHLRAGHKWESILRVAIAIVFVRVRHTSTSERFFTHLIFFFFFQKRYALPTTKSGFFTLNIWNVLS